MTARTNRPSGLSGNALYEYAHVGYVRSGASLRDGAGDPDLFDRRRQPHPAQLRPVDLRACTPAGQALNEQRWCPFRLQKLFLNPNGQVSAVSRLGLGLLDVPAPPQVASSCVPGEADKVARHFAWLGQVEGALSEPLVMDGAGGP